MTRASAELPTSPEETNTSDEKGKKQEMERVQEEAAKKRANEGGYQ